MCKQVLILFLSVFMIPAFAAKDRGAGDPNQIVVASLKRLLTSGELKNALINYFRTLKPERIVSFPVRTTLGRLMESKALESDILETRYLVDEPDCKDNYDQKVAASTEIGKPGAAICFDVEKLANEYKYLDDETMMIRLGSLATHEHVHHFQQAGVALENIANEDEANAIAGYLQSTAKTVQVQILEWDPAPKSQYRILGEAFKETYHLQADYNFVSEMMLDFDYALKMWERGTDVELERLEGARAGIILSQNPSEVYKTISKAAILIVERGRDKYHIYTAMPFTARFGESDQEMTGMVDKSLRFALRQCSKVTGHSPLTYQRNPEEPGCKRFGRIDNIDDGFYEIRYRQFKTVIVGLVVANRPMARGTIQYPRTFKPGEIFAIEVFRL